jgi:hypothetical protein
MVAGGSGVPWWCLEIHFLSRLRISFSHFELNLSVLQELDEPSSYMA